MKDYGENQMLDLITNWLKIPFQMTLFTDPISNNKELQTIAGRVVMSSDQTLAYYSNNNAYDGISHDTKEQFFNHAIYMYLYNLDDVKKSGMVRWIYWNLHSDTLTNGLSWDHDTLTFDHSNTSIKTISALNLLILNPAYRNSLAEKYEELMLNLIDNSYALNKPQFYGHFQKDIPSVLKNYETYMGPGCSPDAAVVLLASLKLMDKLLGIPKAKDLYNTFYKKYGYNIKAKITSNEPEVIISLFILNYLTEDSVFHDTLVKKIGNSIDCEFGNYLYTLLNPEQEVN